MKITLQDVPEEGLDVVINSELEGLVAAISDVISGTSAPVIKGSMHILPIGGTKGFYVRGRINSQFELTCDRCLGPAQMAFDEPFEFQLYERVSVHERDGVHAARSSQDDLEDVELNPGNLDVSFFDAGTVKVEELVREQLLLSTPATVLCSAECKGICQSCGIDRNKEACTCVSETIDPRFMVLKGMKFSD